jgi:hypothetical protein
MASGKSERAELTVTTENRAATPSSGHWRYSVASMMDVTDTDPKA